MPCVPRAQVCFLPPAPLLFYQSHFTDVDMGAPDAWRISLSYSSPASLTQKLTSMGDICPRFLSSWGTTLRWDLLCPQVNFSPNQSPPSFAWPPSLSVPCPTSLVIFPGKHALRNHFQTSSLCFTICFWGIRLQKSMNCEIFIIMTITLCWVHGHPTGIFAYLWTHYWAPSFYVSLQNI
jgi:hypothetical protein